MNLRRIQPEATNKPIKIANLFKNSNKKMNKFLSDDLNKLSDDKLVILRANIETELNRRGISFKVGEVGEKLVISFFNSKPGLPNLLQAPTGAKNVDALSREGDRYSIKTFMKAKKTGTVYPDEKDRDRQLFEYLVVVKLDTNYQLYAIYRYSWEEFVRIRAWDKRMNAWYLPLSKKNLNMAAIIFNKDML
ncbi:hypothetical protein ES707_08457 [subsurface metagenome]